MVSKGITVSIPNDRLNCSAATDRGDRPFQIIILLAALALSVLINYTVAPAHLPDRYQPGGRPLHRREHPAQHHHTYVFSASMAFLAALVITARF